MPKPVTVIAEFKAQEGKEAEALATLMALVEPTRHDEGFINYSLHVKNGDPGAFLFYENWASEEDLDKHSATPHLAVLGAKIADLFVAPPRVDLFTKLT
jgi:quinol monooxygenase YgiN